MRDCTGIRAPNKKPKLIIPIACIFLPSSKLVPLAQSLPHHVRHGPRDLHSRPPKLDYILFWLLVVAIAAIPASHQEGGGEVSKSEAFTGGTGPWQSGR
jgi:hypothetical protein